MSDTLQLQEYAGGLIFGILVSPRSSQEKVGPVVGDRVKVFITAPPVDGKANAAIVNLLAKALGVRKMDVEIIAGAQSKRKTVRVAGIDRDTLLNLLRR